MLERNSKLINKKFYQYLIPSVLTIFAMQFASLFDGIIVGNLLGGVALSASSMAVPVILIVQMPGLALGVGGAIVVGSLLGKRDTKKANAAFSACLIFGIAFGLLVCALGAFIAKPIASLFAVELQDGIYAYLLVYFLGDPIIIFSVLMASFMTIDNNPRLSSFFYILANVIKIASMFLFIQVFNWGMYGAALSLIVGFGLASLSLIKYFRSEKRMLKFTFKLKGCFSDFKLSLKASGATALNYTLNAVQMIIVNIVISSAVTDYNDLLIYGLVCNMIFVFDLFSGGILSLLPSLCGIFNGEKDYYSLKQVAKKVYILNLLSSVIITILILSIPNVYSTVFGFDVPEYQERANFIIRIFVFTFIPYELNIFNMNYYPSIERNSPSYVTVLLREALIVIPVTVALVYTKGLEGYAIAQIITEVATLIITYSFVLIYSKYKNIGKSIFMIPKLDYESYDISIDNNIDNVAIVSKEIADFAINNKIDNRNAQMIALAAEEMISNIIVYGYNSHKQNFIDINFKIISDKIVLRIRDDGVPFDPTKYDFDNNDNYSTMGIKMVLDLTDNMQYMRIINLNNTTIEIKLKETI